MLNLIQLVINNALPIEKGFFAFLGLLERADEFLFEEPLVNCRL